MRLSKLLAFTLLLIPAVASSKPPEATKPAASQSAPTPKIPTEALELGRRLANVAPLPKTKLLEVAKPTLGTVTIEEPSTITLTPRTPVQGRAFINVVGGNVWIAPGGKLDVPAYAIILAMPSVDSFSSYFELSFPTRAGYGYLIDCVVGSGRVHVIRDWSGSTRTSYPSTNGHITFALGKQTSDGSVAYQMGSLSLFTVSSCQVFPVK